MTTQEERCFKRLTIKSIRIYEALYRSTGYKGHLEMANTYRKLLRKGNKYV